jgi:ubiquinone/menaquinone biosynthesis C-methylase UbiE
LSQIGKFRQPDHSGDPRYFIEFLEMVERLPETSEVRARGYRQMRLRPGMSVLDIGCGIGTAVREMANCVGPSGSASGVDISEAMIEEASARMQGLYNVDFMTGEACRLPYPNAVFDAVRMERVLLYVPDRLTAISEMIRVTKAGGRVAITDVDIDCTAIAGKNRAQTRRMTSLVAEAFVHPTSGRELPALMRAAGLKDVAVDYMVAATTHEFCIFTSQGTLCAAAEAGKVSMAEVDEWNRELAELEAAGDFLQLWIFAIAGGTVPEA